MQNSSRVTTSSYVIRRQELISRFLLVLRISGNVTSQGEIERPEKNATLNAKRAFFAETRNRPSSQKTIDFIPPVSPRAFVALRGLRRPQMRQKHETQVLVFSTRSHVSWSSPTWELGPDATRQRGYKCFLSTDTEWSIIWTSILPSSQRHRKTISGAPTCANGIKMAPYLAIVPRQTSEARHRAKNE